jgi:hypothetical protein
LERAALEESVKDALLAAAEHLAEAVRAHLLARGLPDDVCLRVEDGRVVVASRSQVVRRAELGAAGAPPLGVMEGAARDVAPDLARRIAAHLQGALK